MQFNPFADVFGDGHDAVPDRVFLSYQGNQTTYAGDGTRSPIQVAHLFASKGIGADDKVALFLKNCPEHVESLFATIKLRAVPVNVNYRYTDAELRLHLRQLRLRGNRRRVA